MSVTCCEVCDACWWQQFREYWSGRCREYGLKDYWLAQNAYSHEKQDRETFAGWGAATSIVVMIITALVYKSYSGDDDWSVLGAHGVWSFWIIIALETATITVIILIAFASALARGIAIILAQLFIDSVAFILYLLGVLCGLLFKPENPWQGSHVGYGLGIAIAIITVTAVVFGIFYCCCRSYQLQKKLLLERNASNASSPPSALPSVAAETSIA